MTYLFNSLTNEIIDDDGQVVATLSDNAYNNEGEAMRRASIAVYKRYAEELLKHQHGEPLSKVAEAIANSIKALP